MIYGKMRLLERTNIPPTFINWMWEDQYEKEITIDREWKREYTELAKSYGLIKDIQERFKY